MNYKLKNPRRYNHNKLSKKNEEEANELKKSIRHNQLEPIEINTPGINEKHKQPIKTNSANSKKRNLITQKSKSKEVSAIQPKKK